VDGAILERDEDKKKEVSLKYFFFIFTKQRHKIEAHQGWIEQRKYLLNLRSGLLATPKQRS